MSEYKQIIKDFNGEAINFVTQLSKLAPKSIFAGNTSYLKGILKIYPKYMIDQFTIYILKYRDQIDAENNSFFMDIDFTKETGGDDNAISKIFEIKNIWKTLSEDNKKGIFTIMKILCYYSSKYNIMKYERKLEKEKKKEKK